jgi:hypothetical protein
MANLSPALWCFALQLRLGLDLTVSPFNVAAEADPLAAILEQARSRSPHERFLKLLDFAADCVALTAPGRSAAPAANFVAEALARDIAVTAAAAVVLGCHLLRNEHDLSWPDETRPRIAAVLSASSAALEYDLDVSGDPESVLSEKTRGRIEELMHLDAMVWHAFGMDQLRHFVTVRQSHFAALCRRTPLDSADELLLETEGAVMDRNDFAGLLANCITADSLRHAGDLSAFYMRRAASITLDGEFGNPLRRAMARLAIEHGHAVGLELGRFVQVLLDTDREGDALQADLEKSANDFAGIALMYFNAAATAGEAAVAGVTAAVAAELRRRGDGPELDDVRALLELDRIQTDIRRGKALDANAELEAWRRHAGSWLYPSLLRVLYAECRNGAVLREAVRALDHDAHTDTSNCCLLLALSIAHDLADDRSHGAGVVARYLKTGIGQWQPRLTADLNVDVYKSLWRLDPVNRTSYVPSVVRWQTIQAHRDHLRRFPELLGQRRFFLIFADYVRSNQFWGLRADLEPQALWSRLRAPEAVRRARIDEWRRTGCQVPGALITNGRDMAVSSEFLVLGAYLFEPPLDSQASLVEERLRFNIEAERSLLRLLQAVVALPELPRSIRELLRRYSERLYHYSLPPDLPGLSRAAGL